MSYWIYLSVNVAGLAVLVVLFGAGVLILGGRLLDSIRAGMIKRTCINAVKLGLFSGAGAGFLVLYTKALTLVSSCPVFY